MLENKAIRKKTKKIWIGDVPVGGDAAITVQSMTNTNTEDTSQTINQINQLQEAGADIVRVSLPTEAAADSFKKIKSELLSVKCGHG